MLRSDICDFSDAYIVVKETITVTNLPLVSCISKINNTLIDNVEDLDIVMSMYNLREYSKNYSKTTRNGEETYE